MMNLTLKNNFTTTLLWYKYPLYIPTEHLDLMVIYMELSTNKLVLYLSVGYNGMFWDGTGLSLLYSRIVYWAYWPKVLDIIRNMYE